MYIELYIYLFDRKGIKSITIYTTDTMNFMTKCCIDLLFLSELKSNRT